MSIHLTPEGKYQVRWRDDAQRNRQRTFDRKGDAQDWQDDVRRLRQRGHLAVLDGGSMTLSEFALTTMVPMVFSRLAPRTQEFYAYLLSAHILPDLGPLQLRAISAKRLREWQQDRLASKPSAGRYALNRALTLVGQMLQHAVEDGELLTNQAALVRHVEEDQGETVIPLAPVTVERIRQRLELRDRTIVVLGADAGLRPSEIYALRNIEVGERTIHVHRAVDGVGGIKRTKTKATRSVRLIGPLADDLAEWRAGTPHSTAAKALLFPVDTATGVATKYTMDNWRDGVWTAALAAAGVPYQRPYDLRHSFASLLLAEGRTIHYVAQQLGHDAAMTLSTYGHIIAEFEDAPRTDPVEAIRTARASLGSLVPPLVDDVPWPWVARPRASRTSLRGPDGRTRRAELVHVAAPAEGHPAGRTACNRRVGLSWQLVSAAEADFAASEYCATCARRRSVALGDER